MKQTYLEGHLSRVNLTVDIQSHDGFKKVILPHKILVLGNFSAGHSTTRIQARKQYEVTLETRDAVMAAIAPELTLSLTHKTLKLRFKKLQDFHPDELVKQVPALSQLLAMRHLLKDLRTHVVENHEFKQRLNSMVLNETKRHELMQEIEAKL